jgi:tetratricopeptide (TPR) repeat protein
MGLSCEQQYTNVFDTACGKFYKELVNSTEKNEKIHFYNEWKKYKKQCSVTGEYQIFLADSLQSEKKHKEAQILLKKVILEKGKKYDVRAAYQILMHSVFRENKLDEMKELAMQCIIQYPYWYRGYLEYGTALVFQNKFEEGKQYIDKSISLQDYYSEPYGMLTIIYHLHYKDPAMAVKMYKKGLSMKQDLPLFAIPQATFSVVKCAMNQKDYKTAVWALEKEQELFPALAKTDWYIELNNRVNAYFRQNNINRDEVFTTEERAALKAGKDVLEILSD